MESCLLSNLKRFDFGFTSRYNERGTSRKVSDNGNAVERISRDEGNHRQTMERLTALKYPDQNKTYTVVKNCN